MAIILEQSLKRKDRELEHEMERLAKEKVAHQKRILVLKRELSQQFGHDVVLADPELPGTVGLRERCKLLLLLFHKLFFLWSIRTIPSFEFKYAVELVIFVVATYNIPSLAHASKNRFYSVGCLLWPLYGPRDRKPLLIWFYCFNFIINWNEFVFCLFCKYSYTETEYTWAGLRLPV